MTSTPKITLIGAWDIEVLVGSFSTRLHVAPPPLVQVCAERIPSLPVFDAAAPGWVKGERLQGVRTQETTARFLLDPQSLEVQSAAEKGTLYRPGIDYAADLDWGTLGRLPGGKIAEGQEVFASYRHGLSRLDTIALNPAGEVELLEGGPHVATPHPPALPEGTVALYNIWLPGRLPGLKPDHLFPILSKQEHAVYTHTAPSLANRLPKTAARLQQGGRLRILAWGDSVTDGSYLDVPAMEGWQAQFVARLWNRYPHLEIELLTEAWGGHNTSSYLAEPPGSPHNYLEKVLGALPDLVISEFVNDAGLPLAILEEQYMRFLEDFRRIGAEWIILTPHYVRPDWMGLEKEKEVDDDPRPYVSWLRGFVQSHPTGLALADAARKWGRLWRQGLPYTTLLSNAINHPDQRGMELYADSLMELVERE